MNWITLEELILIHERVIEETGGIHGVINPGGLESALASSNGGRYICSRGVKTSNHF